MTYPSFRSEIIEWDYWVRLLSEIIDWDYWVRLLSEIIEWDYRVRLLSEIIENLFSSWGNRLWLGVIKFTRDPLYSFKNSPASPTTGPFVYFTKATAHYTFMIIYKVSGPFLIDFTWFLVTRLFLSNYFLEMRSTCTMTKGTLLQSDFTIIYNWSFDFVLHMFTFQMTNLKSSRKLYGSLQDSNQMVN